MFALRCLGRLRTKACEHVAAGMCRRFSVGNRLRTKIYAENENYHFRDIMRSIPERYVFAVDGRSFPRTLSREEFESTMAQNWETMDPKSVGRAFSEISNYAGENGIRISSPELDPLIDRLTDSMRGLTDEEIRNVCADLEKWPETESVYERNFIEVWAALDDALRERIPSRRLQDLLVFVDCMHRLNLSRKSDFVYYAIRKLARKNSQLTPHQFVQTMFYIAASRKKPIDIMDMERRFGLYMDSLSPGELGVACSGFFKSKSSIKDDNIVERLMDRVTSEAGALNDITLNTIIKLINYSLRNRNCSKLPQMLDAFLPLIPKLSLMCCVQLTLVGTSVCYYHDKLLSAVCEKFLTDPSKARLKDMERLAFAFSLYNHTSNMKFFDSIVDELRKPERESEFAKHGRCSASCLMYLAILEKYPLDLIDRVLNEDFIKSAYGELSNFRGEKSKTAREILLLNCSVDIERPEYSGRKVEQKYLTILAKHNTDFLPDSSGKYPLNITQRTILDIQLTLQKMRGGAEFVHGDHVLPHYQRGVLIMCDDAEGNPVKVVEHFPLGKFGEIRRPPPNDDYTWFAVMFGGKHSLIKNTGQNLGLTDMKLRQLKKIGYIPIMVSLCDWPPNEREKINYITNCMKGNYILQSQKIASV